MKDAVMLAECPIGLFMPVDSNELCLKTEYGNNEGRIDAYIVSSGEFFWGSYPQTIPNQRAQVVRPVDVDVVPLTRCVVCVEWVRRRGRELPRLQWRRMGPALISEERNTMADEETARQALERILYTKIDAGLYKRDAYEIVDAIEAMINEKLAEAMNMMADKI